MSLIPSRTFTHKPAYNQSQLICAEKAQIGTGTSRLKWNGGFQWDVILADFSSRWPLGTCQLCTNDCPLNFSKAAVRTTFYRTSSRHMRQQFIDRCRWKTAIASLPKLVTLSLLSTQNPVKYVRSMLAQGQCSHDSKPHFRTNQN